MTVTATNRKNTFSTNGVTTEFPFDFAITDISQVYAYTVLDGVETVYDNFTVTKNTSSEGGALTTNDVLDDVDLLIFRDVSITQEVDYENGGRFPADSHEQAIDKLTLQNQDQQEEIDRTLKLSIASENSYEISDLEEGKLLGMVDSKIISVDATVEDADDLGALVAFGDEWAESEDYNVTTPDGMEVRSISGANDDVDDAINRLDASATSELNAMSLTLGIPYGDIMYSTDEFEILSYIFTQSDQSCYQVPSGAIGKFIESVVGSQLTTTDFQVYTMTEVSRVNVTGGDVTLTQTGSELQDIVSASMGVSGDGGNLTQTLEEVQAVIDSGEASKIATNMIKESQCVVPAADGSPLPELGTTLTFTDGYFLLANAWTLRTATGTAEITKDTLGNVVLSNFGVATDCRIWTDFPINKLNAAGSGLFTKACYIDDNGELKYFNASTYALTSDNELRIIVDLDQSPTGKLFAISASQEEGDIEILAEQTIIDNVLGGNGDVRNGVNLLDYGFTTSGTYSLPLVNGYQAEFSDYAKIQITGGSINNPQVTTAAYEGSITNGDSITAYSTSGNVVTMTQQSSTTFSVSREGSRGMIEIKGWLKEGVI